MSNPAKTVVNQARATSIAAALSTPAGRIALAQAMMNPIRRSVGYSAIGRKILGFPKQTYHYFCKKCDKVWKKRVEMWMKSSHLTVRCSCGGQPEVHRIATRGLLTVFGETECRRRKSVA